MKISQLTMNWFWRTCLNSIRECELFWEENVYNNQNKSFIEQKMKVVRNGSTQMCKVFADFIWRRLSYILKTDKLVVAIKIYKDCNPWTVSQSCLQICTLCLQLPGAD